MSDTKKGSIPFNRDLAGYEPEGCRDSWAGYVRVQRAFARKAWSWGLPVRQSYRSGPLERIRQPAYVPQDGAMVLFDRACLAAMGREDEPMKSFPRRDCLYAVPAAQMTVHFSFADGSNPFVKFCVSEAEAIHEIWAWSKNYIIMPDMNRETHNIAFFILTEKNPRPGLF